MREIIRLHVPWDAPGEPSRRLGLALLCLALIGFFGSRYDNFLTVSNGLSTALNLSNIAIAAVGTALLLLAGNIDLSIGSQWAFGTMLVGWTAHETQGILAPLVVGLVAGALMGLINGLLVHWLAINPLIVTLGASLVYGGMAYVVSEGAPIYGFAPDLVSGMSARPLGVPVAVVVAAVVFLIGGLVMTATRSGVRIFAIGGNVDAAARGGVHVGRTVVSLFVVNGILIGLVSILTTTRLNNASPQLGATFSLDVLTAVILGGVAFSGGQGHPLGILAGVATIGVLDTGLVFAGAEDWYQDITRGIVLLLALVADQAVSRRRLRRTRTVAASTTADDGPGTGAMLEDRRRSTPDSVGAVVLRVAGLGKDYGAVRAAYDVSFDIRSGEIVCLVGDNGAGKSTVVKMLSGAVPPTRGHVEVNGSRIQSMTVAGLRAAGVSTVYQDLALCPNLSVAQNLVLGDEPLHRNPVLRFLRVRDDRTARRVATERVAKLGATIADGRRLVRDLSGGQRQSVAIARAMHDDTSLMILDEPTAALGVRQTSLVLGAIESIAATGTAVMLITHDVDTVFGVADRVIVMRGGTVVHDGPTSDLDQVDLVHLMAGLRIGNASTSVEGIPS
jgi:ribose/xylose/arabinose/galactoside ABC-type transport system permease subunit/ABC-type branched-subunit amino acid transport system ATPase component